MKTQRNLSGIYFRSKNEDGKWDIICFEYLSDVEQDKFLINHDKDALMRLAKLLANTINRIAEQFDIMSD
jgi:regulator of RNase E activity RraB